MRRRHLGRESWEAVIKAVEELKAPLRPLLQELGVSVQLLSEAKGIPYQRDCWQEERVGETQNPYRGEAW